MRKRTLRAAALVIAILTGVLMLAGCSASGGGGSTAGSDPGYIPRDNASSGGGFNGELGKNTDAGDDAYYGEKESDMDAAPAPGEPVVPPDGDGFVEGFAEKLIYRGSMTLETREYDDTVAALTALLSEYGGFIESSRQNGNTTYSDGSYYVRDRTASYTFRVPKDKFEQFMTAVGSHGNVTASSTTVENITARYVDYDSRLKSLRIQEERLLDMLTKAERVEDMIAIEQSLSGVRYEIEYYTSNLRTMDSQVAYSYLDVYVYEVGEYTPPATRSFFEQLGDAFVRSVRNLGYTLTGIALFIAYNWILIVILAAVLVIVLRTLRKRGIRIFGRRTGSPPAPEISDPADENVEE